HCALIRAHLHEHVARVEATRHRHALAVLDLHHILGRYDRFLDFLLLRSLADFLRNPMVDELLDLVLVTRIGLDRVPARGVAHDHRANTFMMRPITARTTVSIAKMMAATISTNRMITQV